MSPFFELMHFGSHLFLKFMVAVQQVDIVARQLDEFAVFEQIFFLHLNILFRIRSQLLLKMHPHLF